MALATGRLTAPQDRLPALPVIEHPGSRMSDRGDLSVFGCSRASSNGYNEGPLPPLRTERKQRNRDKGKNHSRGQTSPVGQEKNLGRTDGGSSTQSLTRRTVEELEELVKDKLTTGFFGVRQAFRANDPRGRGSVSREAFTTILYHLCGYVSPSLVSSLLQRIGVESPSSISFDDFISHFRDNEVVQKEWLDPVLRPVRQGAHLPANQLRDSQRERSNVEQHEKRKQGLRKTLPVFYTALQVFPLLKRKAQGGLGEFARFLPDSCFDVDGMVLKPQLRQALFLMDIHMYDDEFDKVWDRIDRSGLGTVDSRTFFLTLGLGGNEGKEKQHQKSPIKEQVLEDKPDSVQPASCAKQDSPKTVIPVTVDECQEEKEDIMAVLSNKFKEGYNGIVEMFSRYDPENTGKVSKHELRQVLASYRLTLGPIEVEHFLSRFGCRHDEMVPYRKILDMCQDRTDKGLLQKIMEDPKHRFNKSRDSQIGTTTAVDAEARLLDLLHSDFLSLLGAFKSLDRENMGVVKKYQFKELLEARFGIRLNKEQLAAIRLRIGDDPASGLVPYPRFLEEFNHIRRFSPDRAVEARAATANSQRPSTCPSHPPLVRGGLSPRGVESGATQLDVKKEPESRDADQLMAQLGTLLTEKFDFINKTFIGIDKASRNCGNLTRETFRKLFERHEFKLSGSEVDSLWKKLPIERDGTLNFIELVKTCFSAAGRTPPAQTQVKDGQLSHVLQKYARAQVRKTLERFVEIDEDEEEMPGEASDDVQSIANDDCTMPSEQPRERSEKPKLESTMNIIKLEVRTRWNQIREDLRKTDREGMGSVDSNQFKSILRKNCKGLSDAECENLAVRFTKYKDNSVSYLEFMKFFLPTMPEGSNPIASPRRSNQEPTERLVERRTPSQVAIAVVMDKIRNKMICDWKSLRRAMKKTDMTGDGMVSAADFRATMKSFEFPLDEEDFYQIYSAFDLHMDGRISYVEFMKQALK